MNQPATFPPELTAGGWTSAALRGSCTPDGSGALTDRVSLRAGGTLTYTVHTLVDPAAAETQLQAADTQIIGFVLTYLLPLARPESTSEDPRVLLFVLLILGLAFWNSNAYHFNPMLGLLGFHFYEATFDRDVKYVLITRKDL